MLNFKSIATFNLFVLISLYILKILAKFYISKIKQKKLGIYLLISSIYAGRNKTLIPCINNSEFIMFGNSVLKGTLQYCDAFP